LYSTVSAQVREILDRYTPLVEPLSLDEAFLDVTGSVGLFGPAPEIAAQIRAEVSTELDLRCSVGAAPNKFLAKLASVEAKPVATTAGVVAGAGVVVVDPGAIRSFLDPLPVQRLWGVGPVTLQKLHRIGIRHVADLIAVDDDVLSATLGRSQALHLCSLARGLDDRPVEPEREAKSIGHEETFASNLTSPEEMRTHLVRLADAVATRLRRAGVGARTLTLKVRFDDGFHTITRATTGPQAIDQVETIVAMLQPIMDTIDPSPGVRLVGVSASNLAPAYHQLTFGEVSDEASDDAAGGRSPYGARDAALDRIRDRFGSDAIGPASAVRGGGLRNVKRGAQQWGPDR
jgi:DNA polymerase-4